MAIPLAKTVTLLVDDFSNCNHSTLSTWHIDNIGKAVTVSNDFDSKDNSNKNADKGVNSINKNLEITRNTDDDAKSFISQSPEKISSGKMINIVDIISSFGSNIKASRRMKKKKKKKNIKSSKSKLMELQEDGTSSNQEGNKLQMHTKVAYLTPSTNVLYMYKSYKIVFCLDLSLSAFTFQDGELPIYNIMHILWNCLGDLVQDYSNSNIQPWIYISVIACIPQMHNSSSVFVQGYLLNKNNLTNLMSILEKSFMDFENYLRDQQINQKDKHPTSMDYSEDILNSNTNIHPLLETSAFALEFMPETAAPIVTILTDAMIYRNQVSCEYDDIVMQFCRNNIVLNVISLTSIYNSCNAFGYVADDDLLFEICEITGGFLFDEKRTLQELPDGYGTGTSFGKDLNLMYQFSGINSSIGISSLFQFSFLIKASRFNNKTLMQNISHLSSSSSQTSPTDKIPLGLSSNASMFPTPNKIVPLVPSSSNSDNKVENFTSTALSTLRTISAKDRLRIYTLPIVNLKKLIEMRVAEGFSLFDFRTGVVAGPQGTSGISAGNNSWNNNGSQLPKNIYNANLWMKMSRIWNLNLRIEYIIEYTPHSTAKLLNGNLNENFGSVSIKIDVVGTAEVILSLKDLQNRNVDKIRKSLRQFLGKLQEVDYFLIRIQSRSRVANLIDGNENEGKNESEVNTKQTSRMGRISNQQNLDKKKDHFGQGSSLYWLASSMTILEWQRWLNMETLEVVLMKSLLPWEDINSDSDSEISNYDSNRSENSNIDSNSINNNVKNNKSDEEEDDDSWAMHESSDCIGLLKHKFENFCTQKFGENLYLKLVSTPKPKYKIENTNKNEYSQDTNNIDHGNSFCLFKIIEKTSQIAVIHMGFYGVDLDGRLSFLSNLKSKLSGRMTIDSKSKLSKSLTLDRKGQDSELQFTNQIFFKIVNPSFGTNNFQSNDTYMLIARSNPLLLKFYLRQKRWLWSFKAKIDIMYILHIIGMHRDRDEFILIHQDDSLLVFIKEIDLELVDPSLPIKSKPTQYSRILLQYRIFPVGDKLICTEFLMEPQFGCSNLTSEKKNNDISREKFTSLEVFDYFCSNIFDSDFQLMSKCHSYFYIHRLCISGSRQDSIHYDNKISAKKRKIDSDYTVIKVPVSIGSLIEISSKITYPLQMLSLFSEPKPAVPIPTIMSKTHSSSKIEHSSKMNLAKPSSFGRLPKVDSLDSSLGSTNRSTHSTTKSEEHKHNSNPNLSLYEMTVNSLRLISQSELPWFEGRESVPDNDQFDKSGYFKRGKWYTKRKSFDIFWLIFIPDYNDWIASIDINKPKIQEPNIDSSWLPLEIFEVDRQKLRQRVMKKSSSMEHFFIVENKTLEENLTINEKLRSFLKEDRLLSSISNIHKNNFSRAVYLALRSFVNVSSNDITATMDYLTEVSTYIDLTLLRNIKHGAKTSSKNEGYNVLEANQCDDDLKRTINKYFRPVPGTDYYFYTFHESNDHFSVHNTDEVGLNLDSSRITEHNLVDEDYSTNKRYYPKDSVSQNTRNLKKVERVISNAIHPLFVRFEYAEVEYSKDVTIHSSFTIKENKNCSLSKALLSGNRGVSKRWNNSPDEENYRTYLRIVCTVYPQHATSNHNTNNNNNSNSNNNIEDSVGNNVDDYHGATNTSAWENNFDSLRTLPVSACYKIFLRHFLQKVEAVASADILRSMLSLTPVTPPALSLVLCNLKQLSSSSVTSIEVPLTFVDTITSSNMENLVSDQKDQYDFLKIFDEQLISGRFLNLRKIQQVYFLVMDNPKKKIMSGTTDMDDYLLQYWAFFRIQEKQLSEPDQKIQSPESRASSPSAVNATQVQHFVTITVHHPPDTIWFDKRIQTVSELRERILLACKHVNQLYLLSNLHTSKIANSLLIPPTEHKEATGNDTEEGIPESGSNSMEALQERSDTIFEKPINPYYDGQFSCPKQYSIRFNIFHRLQPEKVLRLFYSSALHPFHVLNRLDTYVYRDDNNNFFYLHLKVVNDFQSNSSLDELEESNISRVSGAETSFLQENTMSNAIELEVYGVDNVGDDITVKLVKSLLSKLSEFSLSTLSDILARNPKFHLSYLDIEFMKNGFGQQQKRESLSAPIRIPPNLVDNFNVLLAYFKQNIVRSRYMNILFGQSKNSVIGQDIQNETNSPQNSLQLPLDQNKVASNRIQSSSHPAMFFSTNTVTINEGQDLNCIHPVFLTALDQHLNKNNSQNVQEERNIHHNRMDQVKESIQDAIHVESLDIFYNHIYLSGSEEREVISSLTSKGILLKKAVGRGLAVNRIRLIDHSECTINHIRNRVDDVSSEIENIVNYLSQKQDSKELEIVNIYDETNHERNHLLESENLNDDRIFDLDEVMGFEIEVTGTVNVDAMLRWIKLCLDQAFFDYLFERVLLLLNSYSMPHGVYWSQEQKLIASQVYFNTNFTNCKPRNKLKDLPSSRASELECTFDSYQINQVFKVFENLFDSASEIPCPSVMECYNEEVLPDWDALNLLRYLSVHIRHTTPIFKKLYIIARSIDGDKILGISDLECIKHLPQTGRYDILCGSFFHDNDKDFQCIKCNKKIKVKNQNLFAASELTNNTTDLSMIDNDTLFFPHLESEDGKQKEYQSKRRMCCKISITRHMQKISFYNCHPTLFKKCSEVFADAFASIRKRRYSLENICHQKLGLFVHHKPFIDLSSQMDFIGSEKSFSSFASKNGKEIFYLTMDKIKNSLTTLSNIPVIGSFSSERLNSGKSDINNSRRFTKSSQQESISQAVYAARLRASSRRPPNPTSMSSNSKAGQAPSPLQDALREKSRNIEIDFLLQQKNMHQKAKEFSNLLEEFLSAYVMALPYPDSKPLEYNLLSSNFAILLRDPLAYHLNGLHQCMISMKKQKEQKKYITENFGVWTWQTMTLNLLAEGRLKYRISHIFDTNIKNEKKVDLKVSRGNNKSAMMNSESIQRLLKIARIQKTFCFNICDLRDGYDRDTILQDAHDLKDNKTFSQKLQVRPQNYQGGSTKHFRNNSTNDSPYDPLETQKSSHYLPSLFRDSSIFRRPENQNEIAQNSMKNSKISNQKDIIFSKVENHNKKKSMDFNETKIDEVLDNLLASFLKQFSLFMVKALGMQEIIIEKQNQRINSAFDIYRFTKYWRQGIPYSNTILIMRVSVGKRRSVGGFRKEISAKLALYCTVFTLDVGHKAFADNLQRHQLEKLSIRMKAPFGRSPYCSMSKEHDLSVYKFITQFSAQLEIKSNIYDFLLRHINSVIISGRLSPTGWSPLTMMQRLLGSHKRPPRGAKSALLFFSLSHKETNINFEQNTMTTVDFVPLLEFIYKHADYYHLKSIIYDSSDEERSKFNMIKPSEKAIYGIIDDAGNLIHNIDEVWEKPNTTQVVSFILDIDEDDHSNFVVYLMHINFRPIEEQMKSLDRLIGNLSFNDMVGKVRNLLSNILGNACVDYERDCIWKKVEEFSKYKYDHSNSNNDKGNSSYDVFGDKDFKVLIRLSTGSSIEKWDSNLTPLLNQELNIPWLQLIEDLYACFKPNSIKISDKNSSSILLLCNSRTHDNNLAGSKIHYNVLFYIRADHNCSIKIQIIQRDASTIKLTVSERVAISMYIKHIISWIWKKLLW